MQRLLAWARNDQAELIRSAAARAGLSIVAAGSGVRGQGRALASALGAEPRDDLRAALHGADFDAVLIADPGDFGGSMKDATAIARAASRGAIVLSLEPIPSTLDADPAIARAADAVRVVPAIAESRPFRAALEASFGPVRAMGVESVCGASEASLGAMLLAALECARAVLGVPERIEACGVPDPSRAGELVGAMRYADGQAASFAVSNRAGRWSRSITLLGAGGRLRCAGSGGVEWIAPDGRTLESESLAPRGAADDLGDAIQAALAGTLPARAPGAALASRAMALSAWLSARTGQPESPATFLEIAGAEA